MRETRKLDDKITIRCEHLKANEVRKISKTTGKTLNELLIDGFLANFTIESPQFKLDSISKQCVQIENELSTTQDKEIFKKGMNKIWETLLSM